MKCPKCGYENMEDALYCNLCQEVLKNKNMQGAGKTNITFDEPQKGNSSIGLYILLISVILIITAGIYFYSKPKAQTGITEKPPINDDEFNLNVVQSEIPVLVDFFAPWCGPCQSMAPVVEDLKTEYEGRIAVYKINTDEKAELAGNFNISGIPTFIFFKNGNEVDRIVGSAPKEKLRDKIEQILQ